MGLIFTSIIIFMSIVIYVFVASKNECDSERFEDRMSAIGLGMLAAMSLIITSAAIHPYFGISESQYLKAKEAEIILKTVDELTWDNKNIVIDAVNELKDYQTERIESEKTYNGHWMSFMVNYESLSKYPPIPIPENPILLKCLNEINLP